MPDSPDYFQYRLHSSRHNLGDMSELAVRLGSPIAADRLGDVVWFSQMDTGIAPFTYSFGGAGADLNIISHNSEYGGYSLTLTAGSDGSKFVLLQHKSNPYELGKSGVEIHIAFTTEFDKLHIGNIVFDGTQRTRFVLELNQTSNVIKCQTTAGAFQEVADLNLPIATDPIWQHIKYVVDNKEGEYIRLQIGNRSINLSGILPWYVATPANPNSSSFVQLYSRSGSNDQCLLDLIVQTVNEPI